MSPSQALELLDQLVAAMQLNRQMHIQAVQAVETLRKVLPKPELKEVEAPVGERK